MINSKTTIAIKIRIEYIYSKKSPFFVSVWANQLLDKQKEW